MKKRWVLKCNDVFEIAQLLLIISLFILFIRRYAIIGKIAIATALLSWTVMVLCELKSTVRVFAKGE